MAPRNSTGALIIKDFQKAVADSPHLGHAMIRNANIEQVSGSLRVQPALLNFFIGAVSQTFTANAATDVCTVPGAIGSNGGNYNFGGMAVTFTTTGTLPAGLALNTTYYLIYASANTFKVATSYKNSVGSAAGTAIDITDAGTGVHSMNVIIPGTMRHIRHDPRTGYAYFLDSNGRVWFSLSPITGSGIYLLTGNTLTQGHGNGLAVFRVSDGTATYLFVFRDAAIDVINVYSTTEIEAITWSNTWQALNSAAGSSNSHYALVGQDNITYFCDDRYVGSIMENAGSVFAPGTPGTYTYNSQALKLPINEVAQCLEELGVNLLTGGLTYNKIYPWDRVSASFTLPLSVPEVAIYRMKNAGSIVYILAGTRGNIYSTQGSYVKQIKHISDYLTNPSETVIRNPVTWGDMIIRNGAILFGVGGQSAANNGVYILYPDGRMLMDNTPSITPQNATALWGTDEFYVVGYVGNADWHDVNRYSTYTPVMQSALYRVANKTTKGRYSQLEVQIAKPESSGVIRVSYRFDTSSSFTVLDTYACDGVSTSFSTDIGLIDIENLQIQVEFAGGVEILQVGLYK